MAKTKKIRKMPTESIASTAKITIEKKGSGRHLVGVWYWNVEKGIFTASPETKADNEYNLPLEFAYKRDAKAYVQRHWKGVLQAD